MYTFKEFINEDAVPSPYGRPRPEIGGGGGGGAIPGGGIGIKSGGTGQGRLTAALRWGREIIAGKPGGSHSELLPFTKDRGKPDEMGFVRKPTGSTEVGPHKGAFFTRQQATRIGNQHPELKNDPTPENDPTYPSQSYDFKPESGKKSKKKVAESFKEFSESEKKDTAKKKKPTGDSKSVNKLGIANKEATHGGMSYYGQGEL